MIRILTSLVAIGLLPTLGIHAATWNDGAARLGCTQRVHASEQAGGSQFLMEFVPQGQKLGSQERMFTVTLVRTSQLDDEANQHLEQVIKSIAAATRRSGAEVIEFTAYKGNYGATAYFEFVLNGEYNVGAIQRTGPGIIAVQQLATFKGRTPTTADRAVIKAMLGIK